jgi:uncharacterized protein involved in response to NO
MNPIPPSIAHRHSLWTVFSAAPHRMLFLPGAVQLVLGMLWWAIQLEGRFADEPLLPVPALADTLVHAWLVLYGLFPFFVFGFLFTALPNWVNGGKIGRPAYVACALLMAGGATLFYGGVYFPPLALIALGLHVLGWGIGLVALLQVLRQSPAGDKRQPWLTWACLLAGMVGDAAFLAWLPTREPIFFETGVAIGIWAFLVPLFLAVCHRMLPWFTSRVVPNYVIVRPYGPLRAMLVACLGHGLLEILGQRPLTWLVDLPLAALALWFISRWGIARSLGERLLAVLHIAFVWAAIAFALYGLSSLMLFLDLAGGLGHAPLHALGIGFFGAMLVGMASRVSLGHSGRPLRADGLTWWLFWGVQVAALARMLPDLLPAPMPYRMVSLSAVLWLAAFGLWAWCYAPLYWRPRGDGKPG